MSFDSNFGIGRVMSDPKGYLKPEQIHPVIEASPYPYNLIYLIAWNTGRRVSEIVYSKDVPNSVGIRKLDLDLLNNRIRFNTLKTRHKDSFMWVDGIDETLMKNLYQLVMDKPQKNPLVFNFRDISTSYRIHVTLKFGQICNSIGIQRIGAKYPHIHHLRHSAIMFMYAKGMKPEEIQLRTGHININNLLYYITVMEIENLTDKFKDLWKNESAWIKTLSLNNELNEK